MAFRFGDFELDEERRELRLGAEPLPLQPRVFDLLALLIRNRDRVVHKDELLDTLWRGAVVGDGALQRAVSLARAALKRGGLEGAIRNYARHGYRFCLETAAPQQPSAKTDEQLRKAREAFERGDWEAAVERFRAADRGHALGAADLECLAQTEECAGRVLEPLPLLERAAAAYSARGDRRGAGRMAIRLAEREFERGRFAVARGWLQRGVRELERVGECSEQGLAAYVQSRVAMLAGDFETAAEHARSAIEIGERLGNEDVEALGRLYRGYSELALGRIDEGLALMDEAAASVIGGGVSPWAGAILYCGLIWVCCNRGDWPRAALWSEGFTRWCDRGGISQFAALALYASANAPARVQECERLRERLEAPA